MPGGCGKGRGRGRSTGRRWAPDRSRPRVCRLLERRAPWLIAPRGGTAKLAARAAPALRHAADGQAVRWPVGRAQSRTDARRAAQRASFKGPAAWPFC
jgi:hypothetical protein